MIGLGLLPGGEAISNAWGVSADGSVIVGDSCSTSSGSGSYEAFRWTETEGMVGLGDLTGGGFRSRAEDVSADGQVVVGYSKSLYSHSSYYEAFRWTAEGGMIGLGDLDGGIFASTANGSNRDGSILVGASSSSTGWTAFLWDAEHGMRSLLDVLTDDYGLGSALAGWELEKAWDITPDGLTIVGQGVSPDGVDEAWIAHLPEPSTLALLLVAGYLAGVRRRSAGT